jgi:hypothetical protein
MNAQSAHPTPQTGCYHIRVKGHLAPRWATRFDAMTLTPEDDGTTLIHGVVVDQAALHGLLQHVRDTGLPLMSVVQVDPDLPGIPPSAPANQQVPNRAVPDKGEPS